MQNALPRIVITSGDPAGIGPDIIVDALQRPYRAAIAVVGDLQVLQSRAKMLGIDCQFNIVQADTVLAKHSPATINLIPSACIAPVTAGKPAAANSAQVVDCINQATDLCVQGAFDAMVTAPAHKAIINDAGFAFTGHTEWIANRCQSGTAVMMLANHNLRVCLATMHLPLAAVPAAITKDRLKQVLGVMQHDLARLYALPTPRIGVCGLNPHAGEGGYLGREEIDIIQPVIDQLNTQGFNLVGALPADTIFTTANWQQLDAVLAMYHDQGLPVIKHQGFGEVVNVTLGLPIIRTSVDHGTAFALAATGNAGASSLLSAINLALKFSNNRIAPGAHSA